MCDTWFKCRCLLFLYTLSCFDPIANTLVYFEVNELFKGVKNGVTTQLMQKHDPYINGVHNMTHHTNLVIQTLSNLSLVTKIGSMLSSTYSYFSHSLKYILR
jgi:hypothetical protein